MNPKIFHAYTPHLARLFVGCMFLLFLMTLYTLQGGPKNGPPVFWDNFGNSAPILTILSLLQAEIYGA